MPDTPLQQRKRSLLTRHLHASIMFTRSAVRQDGWISKRSDVPYIRWLCRVWDANHFASLIGINGVICSSACEWTCLGALAWKHTIGPFALTVLFLSFSFRVRFLCTRYQLTPFVFPVFKTKWILNPIFAGKGGRTQVKPTQASKQDICIFLKKKKIVSDHRDCHLVCNMFKLDFFNFNIV